MPSYTLSVYGRSYTINSDNPLSDDDLLKYGQQAYSSDPDATPGPTQSPGSTAPPKPTAMIPHTQMPVPPTSGTNGVRSGPVPVKILTPSTQSDPSAAWGAVPQSLSSSGPTSEQSLLNAYMQYRQPGAVAARAQYQANAPAIKAAQQAENEKEFQESRATAESAIPNAALGAYDLGRKYLPGPGAVADLVNLYRRSQGQPDLTDDQINQNDPARALVGVGAGAVNAPALGMQAIDLLKDPVKTGGQFAQSAGDQFQNIYDPDSTVAQRVAGAANTALLLLGGYHGLKSGLGALDEVRGGPANRAATATADAAATAEPGVSFRQTPQAQAVSQRADLLSDIQANHQEPEQPALMARNPVAQPKTIAAFSTQDGHVYAVHDDGSTSHYAPVGTGLEFKGRTPYTPGSAITPEATPETPALLARNPQSTNPWLMGTKTETPAQPKALMEQNPVKPASVATDAQGQQIVTNPDGTTSTYVNAGQNTLQLQSKSNATVYVHPDSLDMLQKVTGPKGWDLNTFQDPDTGATKLGVQYTKGSLAGKINPKQSIDTVPNPQPGYVPVETFQGSKPVIGSPIERVQTADQAGTSTALAKTNQPVSVSSAVNPEGQAARAPAPIVRAETPQTVSPAAEVAKPISNPAETIVNQEPGVKAISPEQVETHLPEGDSEASNTTVPAEAKEPWQMTQQERVQSVIDARAERLKSLDAEIDGREPRMIDVQGHAGYATTEDANLARLIEQRDDAAKPVNDYMLNEGIPDQHRVEVTEALHEGKPVPPEVIADYPDLDAKALPAPQAADEIPTGEHVTTDTPVPGTKVGDQRIAGAKASRADLGQKIIEGGKDLLGGASSGVDPLKAANQLKLIGQYAYTYVDELGGHVQNYVQHVVDSLKERGVTVSPEYVKRAISHYEATGEREAGVTTGDVLAQRQSEPSVSRVESKEPSVSPNAKSDTQTQPAAKSSTPVEQKPTAKPNADNPTGLANKFEDTEREASGKTASPTRGISVEDLANQGEKYFKSGKYNLDDIASKGMKITAEDVAAVTYHKRELFNEQADLNNAWAKTKDPMEQAGILERQAAIDKAYEKIADVSTNAGAVFHHMGQALKGAYNRDYSLAEVRSRARAANDGVDIDKPTQDKLDNLSTKARSYTPEELAAAQRQAVEDFKKTLPQASPTKGTVKPRGADLITKARADRADAWKDFTKSTAKVQAGLDPDSLKALGRVAKSFIDEGVGTFQVLADKIRAEHSQLTGKKSDITDEDIARAMLGPERAPRGEATPEQIAAARIRSVSRLRLGTQDDAKFANDVKFMAKSYIEDGAKTPDEILKNFKADVPNLDPDHIMDALSGEYKDKRVVQTAARLKIEAELNGLKQYAQYQKKGAAAKLAQGFTEGLGALRTSKLMLHASAPGMQGRSLIFSDPKVFAKAWPEMLKGYKSGDEAADALMAGIKNDRLYPEMQAAGIDKVMASQHGPLSSMEEQFKSNLGEKIPVFNEASEHSSAAFNGFLNKARWDMVKARMEAAPTEPKARAEYARTVAEYVGTATGRSISKTALSESAAKAGSLLFSPRYLVSKWEYATMKPLRSALARGDSAGAGMVAKNYAKVIPGYLLSGFILQQLGAKVGWDPRKSDFGHAKIGSNDIDIFGAGSQPVRILAQNLLGTMHEDEYGNNSLKPRSIENTEDVLGRYFRNQLAPGPAFAADAGFGNYDTDGKKTVGAFQEPTDTKNPFNWEHEIWNLLSPISVEAPYEEWRKGASAAPLSFFGVSTRAAKGATPNKFPWEKSQDSKPSADDMIRLLGKQ